jgi:hypothetical protein
MKRFWNRLPVVVQISALTVGMPLVVTGLFFMVSDLLETIRSRSVLTTPHLELLVGGAFMAVGMSFLWPLRAYGQRH